MPVIMFYTPNEKSIELEQKEKRIYRKSNNWWAVTLAVKCWQPPLSPKMGKPLVVHKIERLEERDKQFIIHRNDLKQSN